MAKKYPEPRTEHFNIGMFNSVPKGNKVERDAAPFFTPCPNKYYPTVQKLFNGLEVVRAELNAKYAGPDEEIDIIIHYGYRPRRYNRAVGSKAEIHEQARAADIYCVTRNKITGQITAIREVNNYQLAKVRDKVVPRGGRGNGETKTIYHFDIGSTRDWWYSNLDPAKAPQYRGLKSAQCWALWKAQQTTWKAEVQNG